MIASEVLVALDAAIAEARPEERPGLVVALAARLAQLGAGLAAPPSVASGHRATEEPARWLTPTEAAWLAQCTVAQIYSWARGKRWAIRPSRKCLRIEESAFRRWMHARSS